MRDESRSREQLLTEINELRNKVAALEKEKGDPAGRIGNETPDREPMEHALAVREREYKTLLDNLPSLIVRYDRDLRRTYVNPAWERLSGLSAREVLNVSAYDVPKVPRPVVPEYMEKVRYVLDGGDPQLIGFTWENAFGVKLFLEYLIVPEYDHKGNIKGVLGVGHDFTGRKEVEDRLRESEERYRLLVETANEGIWAVGADRRTTFVNRAMADMLGCSPAEVIEKRVEEFFFPEDMLFYEQRIEKRHAGEDEVYEGRFKRSDGSPLWALVSAKALKNSEGAFAGSFAMFTDITERKRMEEALRESEATARTLLNIPNAMAFLLDPDGVCLDANRTFAKRFGKNVADIIGTITWDLFPPEVAGKRKAQFEEVLRNRKSEGYEDEYDGMWIYSIVSPVLDENGNVSKITVFEFDITEQKRSQEALEKRLVTLTRPLDDTSPVTFHDLFNLDDIQRLQDEFADATGVASIITLPDGTPITEPSNFCRLCKDIIRKTEKGLANCYRSDAEIGRPSNDGPKVQQCMSGGLWDAGAGITVGGRHLANWLIGQVRDETQSEESMRVYARSIRADADEAVEAFREVTPMSRERFNQVAQVLFTLARQLSAGAYQNVLQARFIAERKRAEEERGRLQEQLNHAQKMESIGRLAGGVAHDFNNMLSVILGHIEMALQNVDSSKPLFADLMEIDKAARRSVDLTRQLLAFARRQTIAPKVLDLNHTVEGMLKMLRRLIGEDIDLVWLPGRNLWPLMVDPSQIDQILANLCVNAKDAISGVGRVTIETENVSFDENRPEDLQGCSPGRFVMLAVGDDGSGMSKETLGKVFEPFFTTKDLGKGTGLGLATVYGIVKQNRGCINIDSEPGDGTTIRIYLPRLETPPEWSNREKPPKTSTGGTEIILVVEDEPSILTMTGNMLKRLGYTVLPAGTPGEAMRLAEEHAGEIHLLFTDVVMPEMTGRELAGHLLSLYPNLKCLFMSGYTADVIAPHGVLNAELNFISKPFSMQKLAVKVREVLGG